MFSRQVSGRSTTIHYLLPRDCCSAVSLQFPCRPRSFLSRLDSTQCVFGSVSQTSFHQVVILMSKFDSEQQEHEARRRNCHPLHHALGRRFRTCQLHVSDKQHKASIFLTVINRVSQNTLESVYSQFNHVRPLPNIFKE